MKPACALVGFVLLAGCHSVGETPTETDADAAPPAASGASAIPQKVRSTSKDSGRVEQPVLAEDQVRLPLVVLPGDAPVEVDDVVVRRRHGAVELIGHVGDERRIRVFVGSTRIEKTVKIEATEVVPSVIDVRTVPIVR